MEKLDLQILWSGGTVPACHPSIRETKTGRLQGVPGQPGLQIEFQTNIAYAWNPMPARSIYGIPHQPGLSVESYTNLVYTWNHIPAWSTYRIPCQPNLHIEFNARWVYMGRPRLKKPKLNLTKPNIVICTWLLF